MARRIEAYDLARTFAIIFVFVAHIVIEQTTSTTLRVAFAAVSPGLTMSLLGFISAALLSARAEETGAFLAKRFTRIYIPVWLCLSAILIMQSFLGTSRFNTDTVVHFMGLSGVYALLSAPNYASVGAGLWFVTVILMMYLLLPLLRRLFGHRNGLVHLLIVIGLSLAANQWLHAGGAWNVVIAFCLGTYLGVNGRLEALNRRSAGWSTVLAASLLVVSALATADVIPYWFRGLILPLYPLAFIPVFFFAARVLPRPVRAASTFFAALIYEFYILSFYFINDGFRDLFGPSVRMRLQIPIGFVVTLVVAYAMSCSAWVRACAERRRRTC